MNCYAIDIGTNSVRLMYAEVKDGYISPVYKKLITARTGENTAKTSLINEQAFSRTVNAVIYFCDIIKNEDPAAPVFCFATSAVRDAKNGELLAEHIKSKTGITVDILSGEKEAEIGFLGVVGEKSGALLDIGGGSTEIAFGENGIMQFQKSVNTGAVRAKAMFLDDYKRTYEYSRSLFSSLPEIPFGVYACGGTATTAAAMLQKLDVYDSSLINGFPLKREDIFNLSSMLCPLSAEKRALFKGLQKQRADIIPHGLMILLAFLDEKQPKKIIASDCDNLEGYLVERLIKNK